MWDDRYIELCGKWDIENEDTNKVNLAKVGSGAKLSPTVMVERGIFVVIQIGNNMDLSPSWTLIRPKESKKSKEYRVIKDKIYYTHIRSENW